MVKPAQLKRSGLSGGKNHCKGSVPVPTLTRNSSSGLELLLTPIISMAPILRQPGQGRLIALASVSLGTVVTIPGQD